MPWFAEKRTDRTLLAEQRLYAKLHSARSGRSPNSCSRSRSRSETLSKRKERMKELEKKIEDLEGAVLDLEDNADQWTEWYDDWKSVFMRLFARLRYLQ